MVEFELKSNGEENVKIDTCEHGSKVTKKVPGVTKSGNRWRARTHHPKLKIGINLGYYDNQEEAALAVMKKKAEFVEMFKDDCSTNVKTSRDNFVKIPGVRRRGYSRWSAMIYDPKLKREISLGCYDSPEEAATALDNKRDEFLKLYGWRPYNKRGRNTDDKLLEEPNSGVMTTREILDELIDDVNVHVGVKRKMVEFEETFNGKEEVRIDTRDCGSEVRKSVTKYGNSLGYYDNQEEAALAVKKKKSEFLEMLKDENSRNVKTSNREVVTTSDVLPILDELTSDLKVAADVRKLGVNFGCKSDGKFIEESNSEVVHRSHVLVIETESSNSANVNERIMISIWNEQKNGCASEFDEAMSLGFINEYGQLVGKYSELDEQMEFN